MTPATHLHGCQKLRKLPVKQGVIMQSHSFLAAANGRGTLPDCLEMITADASPVPVSYTARMLPIPGQDMRSLDIKSDIPTLIKGVRPVRMSKKTTSRRGWAPWTFKGVSAYAHAPLRRLLVSEAVVALCAAVAGVYFVWSAWIPALDQAATRLPVRAGISQGTLFWPGMLPQQLTESPFLGIVVLNQLQSEVGQVSDIQVELTRNQWRVRSLLGYQEFAYPKGWSVDFSRSEAGPWWGARRPFVLLAVAIMAIAGLPMVWAVLALIYAPFVKLIALFANRPVSFFGAWKLGSAALMPGGLWMCALIVVYGMSRLPLAAFLGGFILHFVVGWCYLLFSPLALPKAGAAADKRSNPFGTPSKKRSNPFQS